MLNVREDIDGQVERWPAVVDFARDLDLEERDRKAAARLLARAVEAAARRLPGRPGEDSAHLLWEAVDHPVTGGVYLPPAARVTLDALRELGRAWAATDQKGDATPVGLFEWEARHAAWRRARAERSA